MQISVECPAKQVVHWRNARIGHVYQSTKHANHFVYACKGDNWPMAVVISTEKAMDIGNTFQPGLDTAWIPCDSSMVIQPMS